MGLGTGRQTPALDADTDTGKGMGTDTDTDSGMGTDRHVYRLKRPAQGC